MPVTEGIYNVLYIPIFPNKWLSLNRMYRLFVLLPRRLTTIICISHPTTLSEIYKNTILVAGRHLSIVCSIWKHLESLCSVNLPCPGFPQSLRDLTAGIPQCGGVMVSREAHQTEQALSQNRRKCLIRGGASLRANLSYFWCFWQTLLCKSKRLFRSSFSQKTLFVK